MTIVQTDEFLISKEAQAVLRVSESTISRWIADGTVPSVKVGGRRLIPRAAIAALVDGALADTDNDVPASEAGSCPSEDDET